MAPPSISASEVSIDAATALPNSGMEYFGLIYSWAASERHLPVTIPRWATLCCNTTSITVDKDITQSNE
jgi:hypothetical protein